MTPEESTARWIELLSAQRSEHLARLHGLGRQLAFGALALSIAILLAVVLGIDALWDASLEDSPLARMTAVWGGALFAAACALVALAVQQERRDRGIAIAYLDRAIPELLAGSEPRTVLTELSERMRRLAPPRGVDPGAAPYLPSRLDARWLGTRAYTKLCLGCAALLLAALLAAATLLLAAPPYSGEDDDGGSSSTTSLPWRHERM